MSEIVKQGWPEETMRAALHAFCNGRQRLCVPPQADDTDLVLLGTIDEVLALRAENANLRAVVEAAELAHTECECSMFSNPCPSCCLRAALATLDGAGEGG